MPPVRLRAIWGAAHFGAVDALPVVRWHDGRCWAFLHDLAYDALDELLAQARRQILDRDEPHRQRSRPKLRLVNAWEVR